MRAPPEDTGAATRRGFLRRRSSSTLGMSSVESTTSVTSSIMATTRLNPTMFSNSNNSNNNDSPSPRPKKVLRFGATTIHEVEKIPAEEQSSVWYNKAELEVLYAAEVDEMKECEKQCWKKSGTKCDSHTRRGLEASYRNDPRPRHKHVRHVIAIFRMQRKKYQGYWEPQTLRRVSKFASKDNRRVAVKRAKKDYMDAHDKGLLSSIMSRVSLAA